MASTVSASRSPVDLATRFGLGHRLGAPTGDVMARLRREIALPSAPDPQFYEGMLPTGFDAMRAAGQFQEPDIRRIIESERRRVAAARETAMKEAEAIPPGRPRPPLPPGFTSPVAQIVRNETTARFTTAERADIGFVERLVWFWSNHFTVSWRKSEAVGAAAGAFEREAIRPHVLGRFRDMLGAAARHPAMLVYLDADQSIGPNAPTGRRRGRGLNENLAREILELHTLGVDGGYSQADVTAFALALTGWTVSAPADEVGEMGQALFNRRRHEPGPKTVLGRRFPMDGPEQLEAILDMLASHPATARRVALRLAQHFVADDPPKALTERLARTFNASSGDLRAVALALLSAPEATSGPALKLRTPAEFLSAMHRAGAPFNVFWTFEGLRMLGAEIFMAASPKGYPDDVEALATPVSFKARLELSALWAQRMPGRIAPADALAVLPQASEETRRAVLRAESRQHAFALLFMAPEFQRR